MRFPDLTQLRGIRRTAAVALWFQDLFPQAEKPVLVGGAAVELYTGGAYTTGDLDFVGRLSPTAEAAAIAVGFRREGRHLVRSEGEIFIELPSAALQPGEEAVALEFEKSIITIVSPEDLVVDRLAAWRFWSSERDAVQALELLIRQPKMDEGRLRKRASQAQLSQALTHLANFADRDPRSRPSPERIASWLREAPWK